MGRPLRGDLRHDHGYLDTRLLQELRRHQGATPLAFRKTLAVDAFARTARYDAAINNYLRQHY
ncbi:MAG: hypothetical protein JRM77_10165, partial [Nitrososphaerota archaeon]|nr:hypothetical protein [Nitrososphaerota archaeon]